MTQAKRFETLEVSSGAKEIEALPGGRGRAAAAHQVVPDRGRQGELGWIGGRVAPGGRLISRLLP